MLTSWNRRFSGGSPGRPTKVSYENQGSGGHLLRSDGDLVTESSQLLDGPRGYMLATTLIVGRGGVIPTDLPLLDQIVGDDEDRMTHSNGSPLGTPADHQPLLLARQVAGLLLDGGPGRIGQAAPQPEAPRRSHMLPQASAGRHLWILTGKKLAILTVRKPEWIGKNTTTL